MAVGRNSGKGKGTLPNASPGQPILPKTFNAPRDVVAEIVGGPGIAVFRGGNRITISAIGDQIIPVGGGEGTRFALVVEEKDDFIDCNFYNPVSNTTGGAVNVAKPWLLRNTPFDGVGVIYPDGTVAYTYSTSDKTRSATDGTFTETQTVTPQYFVGGELSIEKAQTGVTDTGGTLIVWQDKNTGARTWARGYTT